MIRHREYTRERLAATAERLRAAIRPESVPLDSLLVAGPVDRISYEEAQRLEYVAAQPGARYGPLWATYWFRLAATVPERWAGRRVDLIWASRAESTLWLGEQSVQGLHGVEPHQRPDATVLACAVGGERLELQVELACNGLFGRLDREPEVERPRGA